MTSEIPSTSKSAVLTNEQLSSRVFSMENKLDQIISGLFGAHDYDHDSNDSDAGDHVNNHKNEAVGDETEKSLEKDDSSDQSLPASVEARPLGCELSTSERNPTFGGVTRSGTESVSDIFKSEGDNVKTGPNVQDHLAAWVADFDRFRDPNDIKKMADAYKMPGNVVLNIPKVEPFIWDKLPKNCKATDQSLQSIQKSIHGCLKPVLQMCDILSKTVEKDEGLSPTDSVSLLKIAADALALTSHSNTQIGFQRRQNIKPFLDSKFHELCNLDNPITDNLFGENVQEKVSKLKESSNVDITKSPQQKTKFKVANRYQPYPSPSKNRAPSNFNFAGLNPNWRQRFANLPFLGRNSQTREKEYRSPYQNRNFPRSASNRPKGGGEGRRH